MPRRPVTPQRLFGDVVRTERSRQGISQEELAHRSGISTSFMSHVECGTKTVSIETIAKVAAGLGVKGGELLLKAGI
ncbi:MAG: Helix-turn-helix domain [Verrucomicrobiota bacterium]|jgi:transcriptional regulator with XRE-family HTH domain